MLVMHVVWKEITNNELVHRMREEAVYDPFRTGKAPYDDDVFFISIDPLGA